jgi:hypothetical protein
MLSRAQTWRNSNLDGRWPCIARDSAEDLAQRRYAQIFDSTEKIADSVSGQLTEWNNARRWPSVDTDTILDLKSSPGREALVYGSVDPANTLTAPGLIDRYDLPVHPIPRSSASTANG